MRIAHVAPLFESVPPRYYGGTERIITYLVDGLVELGHEVTLFASGDSKTTATLVPVRDQALRLDPYPLKSQIAAHLAMLDEVRLRADEFDIIHFHLSHFLHFPFFEHMPERTVTTPHGRLDYKDLPGAYRRWPRFPMISISHRQRQPLAEANWVGTVHHGLPLELYRPIARREAESGYLAFLGRLSRDKRPDRAIEIARRSGMKLYRLRRKETVGIRIVDRLDAQDVRARRQPRDHEVPCRVERKVADEDAGLGIEGDDVRADHALAVLGDAADDAAGVERSTAPDRESEMPAMSSACSTRSAVAPAVIAIGNITAPLPMHAAAAAAAALGLADRGVAEPEQVPELVQHDRLEIDAIGLAIRRHRKQRTGC